MGLCELLPVFCFWGSPAASYLAVTEGINSKATRELKVVMNDHSSDSVHCGDILSSNSPGAKIFIILK